MKKLFTLALFTFVLLLSVQAQTYTTMQDGAINDINVWSLDGGATHCFCQPTMNTPSVLLINGGNVEVNHNISLPKNTMLFASGLYLNVNPTGAITGNYNLDVRAGVLNNYATIDVTGMTVYNGGFLNQQSYMNISPGDFNIAFQGRVNLAGYTVVAQGNFSNIGTLDIRANATFEVAGSFNNNTGYINMEPASCINVIGNVENNGFIDLIGGPGNAYIQSGNNLTNNVSWNTDVDYCAAGTAVGLSHTANCANCGILPVELVSFNASLDNGQVTLVWETASETGNHFFTIERSMDGETFEALTAVNSDNPVGGKVYQAFDAAPFSGTSYYRLSQTDLDGTSSNLETQMVLNGTSADNYFNVFPNPFTDKIRVTTFGMEGAPVEIHLLDLSGKVLATKQVENPTDFTVYELQPGELVPGMYIVTMQGKQKMESFRLIHQ